MFKFLSVYIKIHRTERQQSSTGIFFMEFRILPHGFQNTSVLVFSKIAQNTFDVEIPQLSVFPKAQVSVLSRKELILSAH
jgi:hypothetical protein